MRYPILTIYPTEDHEQIEYTATSPDHDGNVEVYVEVPKLINHDWEFAHLTVLLPAGDIIESYGFTEQEQNEITNHIHNLQNEILEYVEDREIA